MACGMGKVGDSLAIAKRLTISWKLEGVYVVNGVSITALKNRAMMIVQTIALHVRRHFKNIS